MHAFHGIFILVFITLLTEFYLQKYNLPKENQFEVVILELQIPGTHKTYSLLSPK
jgi:hypothetical protein